MQDAFCPASEPPRGARDRTPGFSCRVGRSSARPMHFALESPRARDRTGRPGLTLPVVRADVVAMLPAVEKSVPPDTGDTDEALIAGAAGGEKGALAQLYDRYASSLLAAGERILGGRRDAEDLLHDVFVEVWQQAGAYDPVRGSVKSWLFLRMRSRAIDRLRLASKKNVELGEKVLATATHELTEDPALSPDRAQVRTRLEVLPHDQRVAIELAYFGGLSGAQIAAQLGVPLGTVKTRLALGMSKLRAALGEEREVGE
jgi:RNA polymerase sigma-70 factor, ECF subfamily